MEEFLELSSHFPFPHSSPAGVCLAFSWTVEPITPRPLKALGWRVAVKGGNGTVSSHLCFIFTRIQVERPHYAKDERLGLAGPTFGGPAGNCLGSKEPGSTLWR